MDISNLIGEGAIWDAVKANAHTLGGEDSGSAMTKYARQKLKESGKDLSDKDADELLTKRAKHGFVGGILGGPIGSTLGGALGGAAGNLGGGDDVSIMTGAAIGSGLGGILGSATGTALGRAHGQHRYINQKLSQNKKE
jgi:hypothetical protein